MSVQNSIYPSTTNISQLSLKDQTVVTDLIKTIADMFEYSNLNFWGVEYTGELAPLCCLKCGKAMYRFDDFFEYGPRIGRNTYFCDQDEIKFNKKIIQLKSICFKNQLNFCSIYFRATQPLIEKEEWIRETYQQEINQCSNWTILGTKFGTDPNDIKTRNQQPKAINNF